MFWSRNNDCMTASSTTRRRAVGADVPVRSFGQSRSDAPGCEVQLSSYNPAHRCYIHNGWDRQPGPAPAPLTPSQPLAASGSLLPRAPLAQLAEQCPS